MWQQILPGIRIKLFMTIMLGVIYPLAITGISQVFFPRQANGSLLTVNGKSLDPNSLARISRSPSTSSRVPQPRAMTATIHCFRWIELRTDKSKARHRVKASIDKFRKDNPDYTGPLPADLVTASASGLDPHLSPDSANAQAARVAKARGVSTDQVSQLIAQLTEGPDLGLLGEPRVNVLKLNLALDDKYPEK